MLIIGLTGSIGMGKSTAADWFRQAGVPVFDADRAVHDLYAAGGAAVRPISKAFPGTMVDGAIDRTSLGAAVVGQSDQLARLEAIVHPLVRDAETRFLRKAEAVGESMAVLEIPLLFETGADANVDVTIVVSAPADVQRDRVLERPGMSSDKFDALLTLQMPDDEKRKRADYVVDTSGDMADSKRQIADIVRKLSGIQGRAFDRHWRATAAEA